MATLFAVKKPLKYALILAAVYLVPLIHTGLRSSGKLTDFDVKNAAVTSVLLANPLAALVVGGVFGWRHGCNLVAPLLFGVAFLPALLILFNSTALAYVLAYAALGLLGEVSGLGLRWLWGAIRSRRVPPAPRPPDAPRRVTPTKE